MSDINATTTTILNTNQRRKITDLLGDAPFLVHHTNSLLKIIETEFISPSSETDNINYGDGIYKDDEEEYSPFVFFSVSNAKLLYHNMPVSIIFPTDILTNKPFYVNRGWRGGPMEETPIMCHTKEEINAVFKPINEDLLHLKSHNFPQHYRYYEIMIERKIPLLSCLGIILIQPNPIYDNFDMWIEKLALYKKKYKKYKEDNDTKKMTKYKILLKDTKDIITRKTKRIENERNIIEFCKLHNKFIIYKAEKSP